MGKNKFNTKTFLFSLKILYISYSEVFLVCLSQNPSITLQLRLVEGVGAQKKKTIKKQDETEMCGNEISDSSQPASLVFHFNLPSYLNGVRIGEQRLNSFVISLYLWDRV